MTDPLSAAAEPTRRRILQLLASGPRSVSALAAEFTVTRSAVSQHLLLLVDVGLVRADKVGRERIYRVVPGGLRRLQAEIDRFWTDELGSLVADAQALHVPFHRGDAMSYSATTILPVGIDEAFALITDPDRLRRWQVVTARVDLRAGGGYRWTVVPGHAAAGTYREVEPGRRVVFGWGWEGSHDLAPDASTVTITVEPVDDGTRVTLLHDGLTEAQAASHAEGWQHYLGRLERAAATGDAGPDDWAAAPDPLDELTAAEAALASLQHVLRGLTDADRPKQTPCTDFTCHDLAEHLLGSLAAFGAMAGAEVVDPGPGPLENRVAALAAQVLEAWRARGVDGDVPAPDGGRMPAAVAAGIMPVELLLHAWDMAQGSGRPLVVGDAVVAYVAKLAEQVVPGARGTRFADAVVVPEDAPAMDRLAAYAGRRPAAA